MVAMARRFPRARAGKRDGMRTRLYTDGGARGNPGPAAYAFVLEAEDGTVLAARGEAIGVATNNVAEYRALVAGLEKAAELGVDELEVVSDSELVVKQMRGEYRVKNEALRALSLRAAAAAHRVGRVTYTAVRREHNELADRLVNEALDARDPAEPGLYFLRRTSSRREPTASTRSSSRSRLRSVEQPARRRRGDESHVAKPASDRPISRA